MNQKDDNPGTAGVNAGNDQREMQLKGSSLEISEAEGVPLAIRCAGDGEDVPETDEADRQAAEVAERSGLIVTAGSLPPTAFSGRGNGDSPIINPLEKDWSTPSGGYRSQFTSPHSYQPAKSSATPPQPKVGKPKFEQLNASTAPLIKMTVSAWQDTFHIIDSVSGNSEVGWLGTVKEEGGIYVIDQVFLFEQRAHAATCEFSGESIAAVIEPIMATDPKRGCDIANRLRFWGHLHPHGSTSPSGQDEDQVLEFKDSPWFIRGIFTPSGDVEFVFYDFKRNCRWRDCSWGLVPDGNVARRAEIEAEVRDKVKSFYGSSSYTSPFVGSNQRPGAVVSRVIKSVFGIGDGREERRPSAPLTHRPLSQTVPIGTGQGAGKANQNGARGKDKEKKDGQ